MIWLLIAGVLLIAPTAAPALLVLVILGAVAGLFEKPPKFDKFK